MGNLPLKDLNRLRLGESVAAEVESGDLGFRSWIMISPIRGEGGTRYAPTIIQYRILHYEVKSDIVDRLWDDNLQVSEGRFQLVSVAKEEDIASAISQWLRSYDDLRDPGNVPDCYLAYDRICALFEIPYIM